MSDVWKPEYYVVVAHKDPNRKKREFQETIQKIKPILPKLSKKAPPFLIDTLQKIDQLKTPNDYFKRKISPNSDMTIGDCVNVLLREPSFFEKFAFFLAGYGWGRGFWKSKTIYYQIMQPNQGHIIDPGYELIKVNSFMERRFKEAITHYSNYLDLEFIEVKDKILKHPTYGKLDRGQLRFGIATKGFWGGDITIGTGYYPGMKYGGDILTRKSPTVSLLTHEIGHAMGLAHGKSDLTIQLREFALKYFHYDLNDPSNLKNSGFDADFTCMVSGFGVRGRDLPGIHDVFALQTVYGAKKMDDFTPLIYKFMGSSYSPYIDVYDFDDKLKYGTDQLEYVLDNPLFGVYDASSLKPKSDQHVVLEGRALIKSGLAKNRNPAFYNIQLTPRSRIFSFVTSPKHTKITANGLNNTIIFHPKGSGVAKGLDGLDYYVFPTSNFSGKYYIHDQSGYFIFPDSIIADDLELRRYKQDVVLVHKGQKICCLRGFYKQSHKKRNKNFRIFGKKDCQKEKNYVLQLLNDGYPFESTIPICPTGIIKISKNFGTRIVKLGQKRLQLIFTRINLKYLKEKQDYQNKDGFFLYLVHKKNPEHIIFGFKKQNDDLIIGYLKARTGWINKIVIKEFYKKQNKFTLRDKDYTSIEHFRDYGLIDKFKDFRSTKPTDILNNIE